MILSCKKIKSLKFCLIFLASNVMGRILIDSGIDWVKEIPQNWKISKIGQKYSLRATKVSDKDYEPLSVTYGGVVPQLENVAKTDAHDDRKLVKKGDFAINSRSDRRGACGIADRDGSVSLINIVLKPYDNMVAKYYEFLFHSVQFGDEFYKWGHGIVDDLWTTHWQDMKKISIPVPPLAEQQKIADYLDKKTAEIDAAINEAKNLINKYKDYKQSKVKEIFDLYLSTEPFVNAKLGSMSSLVTKQTGFDYSNTISPSLVGEPSDDTLPYIQTRHFKDNYWNYETEYYIPRQVAKLFPRIILKSRCMLFSIVGASIGNVAIYPGIETAFLGGAICKVDLYNSEDYDYIKNYMMSCYGQEQIIYNIKASAQGTITVQNVRDFKIPMFKDKKIKQKISVEVDKLSQDIYVLIEEKEKLISQLQEYKKSIIFEYVTGKKEIPNG